MADYYPLISKAVAGLDKDTGEARRALYERARQALVAQLRGVEPALSESDITRERLGLEEAIRRVEAESARRMRTEMPRAEVRARVAPQPEPVAPPPVQEPEAEPAPEEFQPADELPASPPPPPPPPVPDQKAINLRSAVEQLRRPNRPKPVPPEAAAPSVKALRDAVAEADTLGEATAKTARDARESFAAMPSPGPSSSPSSSQDQERVEPRLESDALRPPTRRPQPPPRPRPERQGREEREERQERSGRQDRRERPERDDDDYEQRREPQRRDAPTWRPVEPPPRPQQGRRHVNVLEDRGAKPGSGISRLIGFAVFLLVLVGLGFGIYWQSANIGALPGRVIVWMRGSSKTVPTQQEVNTQSRSKITDRVTSGQQGTSPDTQEAPVAQRVVLYEEDTDNPDGRRSVGTSVWRAESIAGSGGQPAETGVRADIAIPERNIAVTFTLRRNLDKDLPASHTVSIMFTLPPDFAHGGIAEIRGLLMKQSESTRGVPLSGLAVKVTENYFLIGLTATEAEISRNIKQLKEMPWFDIAIVYTDGKRAIMAVEKGTPGDRAFTTAFNAWGQ